MLNEKKRRELLGLSLLALSIFTLLSLIPSSAIPNGNEVFASGNIMGVLGRLFAAGAYGIFGVGALSIPIIFLLSGSAAFDWLRKETAAHWVALSAGLALIAPAIAALFTRGIGPDLIDPHVAGWIGVTLTTPVVALLGHVGGSIALGFLTIAVFVATIGWNPVAAAFARLRQRRQRAAEAGNEVEVIELPYEDDEDDYEAPFAPPPLLTKAAPAAPTIIPKREKKEKKAPVLEDFGDPRSEDLPPITLLTEEPPHDMSASNAEFDRLGNVLVQTLRTFKVETEVVG
ncbi:MAG TPA: DNA translocase FtsK 4TM domain-containing protein, partial [Longimicrobiales bacterium]